VLQELPSMSHLAIMVICTAVAVLQAEPGRGASVVLNDIRVTLLDAKRLSFEEYREARKPESAAWGGGGFRFTFVVENRPHAPLPPALGEVRVSIGSQLYNPVTNSNSQKPFAPLIVIRDASDFFATTYGAALRTRVPEPRPATTVVVLEVFIPGGLIPPGTSGVVDLEQGETHRQDAGRLRQLRPEEIAKTWTRFRFSFPPLD
jgi:hypothetical protein